MDEQGLIKRGAGVGKFVLMGLSQRRGSAASPDSARPLARRGTLLASGAVVLFGYFAVVAIDLLEFHTAIEMTTRHSAIAAVVLFGAAARRGALHPRGRLGTLAAMGACIAAMAMLFFVTLERLGAGPTMTLQFVAVLVIMIWTRSVRGAPVPPVAWVAGLVTVVGISLVVEAWVWERVDVLGIVCGVVASVFLAGYLLMADHLGGRLSPVTVAAYSMAVAALIALPFSGPGPMDLPASRWWSLLALGVLGTAVPVVMEVAAVRDAGPGPVGMIVLTQPVVGGVAAWFLLGQTLGPVQMVGIGISLAGVLLVQLKVTQALA